MGKLVPDYASHSVRSFVGQGAHPRLHAEIAQLVERIHGKDEVPGSIPGLGSKGASVNQLVPLEPSELSPPS